MRQERINGTISREASSSPIHSYDYDCCLEVNEENWSGARLPRLNPVTRPEAEMAPAADTVTLRYSRRMEVREHERRIAPPADPTLGLFTLLTIY